MEKKMLINGMMCGHCKAVVEKALCSVDGVESCSVNLLTNSMSVEGTVSENDVIDAVVKAGYSAKVKGNDKKTQIADDESKNIQTATLIKRLIASAVFLLMLMYFSMFHTMWGAPLPSVIANNYILQAAIQLVLTTAVMLINVRFFTSGIKAVIKRAPNMDTLVSLGSAAAYVYSVANVIMMLNASDNHAKHLLHGLYFESAAMILTLITVGKLLETHAKGKTTNAIKSLLELAPKTVTVIKDGKEII